VSGESANLVGDPAQLSFSPARVLHWYFESTYAPGYGEGPDSLANWSILHLGLLIGLVLTVFQLRCHFQPDDLVPQGVVEACGF